MRALTASLMLLGAMLIPAAVQAQTVPPGNSGADQYAETLPGPGGNQKTGSGGGGGKQGGALSPATEQQLQQLGPDGQATADLAQATAPRRAKGGDGSRSRGAGSGSGEPSGSSGFTDVLEQAAGKGDSGGMGILLPLILAASLLAGLAFLLARRRGGDAAEDAGQTG